MSKKGIVFVLFVLLAVISFSAVGYDLEKVIIVPIPQEFEVSIWLDKDPGSLYKNGEAVKVFFKTNADAYVTIYDIMPDGKVQLIFPNKYDTNNFVKANKEYTLPTDSAKLSYQLLVSGESGMEIFQIVASKKQLPFLKSAIEKFSKEAFPLFEDLADTLVEKLVKPFVEKEEYAVAQTYFYVNTRPAQGTLSVNSSPAGANVYIDGSYYGTTPLRVSLAEGVHLVNLYKSGYSPFSKQVNIRANMTSYLNVALSKTQKQKFSVGIDSNPSNAKVYIDGVYRGVTPLSVELTVGAHTLELEKENYEKYTETINVSGPVSKFINLRFLGYLLSISSDPSNAEVYISGEYVGNTPLQKRVSKGWYRIVVKKDGYQEYSKLINISNDANLKVNLERITPPEGTVFMNYAQERVNIYVDGVFYGVSPGSIKLQPGSHKILAVKTGYQTQEYNLNVNAGSEYYLSISLIPEMKPVILRITTSPADARVFINGEEIGKSPITVDLDPGYYELLIIKEGYHFIALARYFQEGDYSLNFDLQKIEE
ncbi:hypothetical protein AT15_07850 [Kosmotoga arenicorallina S304]|uniref:S-layer protein n=1 Tax=Kosmotoga arenicorallina S304 TaxID=1453497 RepID=A0A182C7C4_9BACT|nr:PEGA domain-containing protein [Kosmotoga arenicorallina]OAA31400.1 hypothetical protein AT15_07850 [Kosmotoga arenicorallina S304]